MGILPVSELDVRVFQVRTIYVTLIDDTVTPVTVTGVVGVFICVELE